MSDERQRIEIHVFEPTPTQPAICPPHIWAWANLSAGGTVAVCCRCGREARG